MIRVLIADDHELARGGVRGMLAADPDFEIVGEAADGAEAVEQARQAPARTSCSWTSACRGSTGSRRPAGSRRTADPPRVLVLTTFDLDEYVYEALRAGASGFMLKDAPPGQLREAVRTVANGETLLAPGGHAAARRALRPAAGARARPRRSGSPQLTERELEVLKLIATGLSNREIAAEAVPERGDREDPLHADRRQARAARPRPGRRLRLRERPRRARQRTLSAAAGTAVRLRDREDDARQRPRLPCRPSTPGQPPHAAPRTAGTPASGLASARPRVRWANGTLRAEALLLLVARGSHSSCLYSGLGDRRVRRRYRAGGDGRSRGVSGRVRLGRRWRRTGRSRGAGRRRARRRSAWGLRPGRRCGRPGLR